MTGVKKLYWKTWLKAAAIRAVKTFAQTAAALLGAGAINVIEVDWLGILGVSATAAVASILTSLSGLPEVDMTLGIDRSDTSADDLEV